MNVKRQAIREGPLGDADPRFAFDIQALHRDSAAENEEDGAAGESTGSTEV